MANSLHYQVGSFNRMQGKLTLERRVFIFMACKIAGCGIETLGLSRLSSSSEREVVEENQSSTQTYNRELLSCLSLKPSVKQSTGNFSRRSGRIGQVFQEIEEMILQHLSSTKLHATRWICT
jgi:hypothetical protein